MTPRPVVRPEDLSTSLVLAAKDGICTAAGVEILEVVTKTGVDAALSRPKGMDTRRWDQIYQMLTESFASREFKNATWAILPATLDETIAYIHEAFNARLLNQKDRQRRLANLIRRAKRGDLRGPHQSTNDVKPLAELIEEVRTMPIGTHFDQHELAFWTDVFAIELGIDEREIRQFFWQAEADDTGKYRCITTRKKERVVGT